MVRVLAMVVLALGACGGSSSPAEKCDDLVHDICARGVECVGGGTQAECEAAVKADLSCGNAVKVSASYDECIDQVNTNTCDALFPVNQQSGERELLLPADCNGVILF